MKRDSLNTFNTFRSQHPLNMTWAHTRILEGLRRASGPMSTADLYQYMHGGRTHYGDPHVVAVHICRMRKLLAPHDIHIVSQKARGYSISATDRLKLDRLLGALQAADALTTAPSA